MDGNANKGNSSRVHQSNQKLLCQVELWQERIVEIKRLLGSLDLLCLTFTSIFPENNWFAWGKKKPKALCNLAVPGLSHLVKTGCALIWSKTCQQLINVIAHQEEGGRREDPATKGNVLALHWAGTLSERDCPMAGGCLGKTGIYPQQRIRNIVGCLW